MVNRLVNDLVDLYTGQNIRVRSYVNGRVRILDLDSFTKHLPHEGVLVDIGCGYGVLANYLSLCYPNSQIIGLDLVNDRIKAANKTVGHRTNIMFLLQDARRWSWPGCAGITMTDFLHHIPKHDQQKIIETAFHNLTSGGALVISEVDPTARPLYRYWASYLSDRILYPLSRSYFRKPSEWEGILSHVGFNVKTIRLHKSIFAGILYVGQK